MDIANEGCFWYELGIEDHGQDSCKTCENYSVHTGRYTKACDPCLRGEKCNYRAKTVCLGGFAAAEATA